MADIHVLAASKNGESQRLVFHFPVADTQNDAGVSYRTALVQSGLGGTTVLPAGDGTGGTISAAEKAQVEAGERYEYAVSLTRGKLISGGTTPQALAKTLRHFYGQAKADQTAQLTVALKRFGQTLNQE